MEVCVKEFNKKYEMNIGSITQILGTNFRVKQYIYNSIVKHFSLYKYQEYDECMENNILINGDEPGRKEYKVICIDKRDTLIEQIKLNKNTLIYEYLKNTSETLQCQKKLNEIDEILTKIYMMINEEINKKVGSISIDYDIQNLLQIVSKSYIIANNGDDIEKINNFGLFNILLKLIKENNSVNPEKILLLVPDVDHLLTRNEYKKIIKYLEEFDSNVYIVFFISVDKYVCVNKKNMSCITVFNDVPFIVPDYDIIEEYIQNHYPVNCEFNEAEVLQILENELNKIGIENERVSYKDVLVKKLINKALCVNDEYDFEMTSSELSCFNSK